MITSVRTENLTKSFGKFTAVDQLSIDVKEGEIFGFLGANGAGKTTAIRMLCGLLQPTSGKASVCGYDIYTKSETIKKNIGYMSQKFSLYDDLTVSENISLYAGIYGLKKVDIDERKELLLNRIGLKDEYKKMTGSLPLGYKQRLALGCSLIHNPPVLFLDEPTSGVDPKARRSFWDLIYLTLQEGKTIFVTTHFMDEAEYCHRVSIMRNGKLIELDSPEALKDKYNKTNMQDVFLALV